MANKKKDKPSAPPQTAQAAATVAPPAALAAAAPAATEQAVEAIAATVTAQVADTAGATTEAAVTSAPTTTEQTAETPAAATVPPVATAEAVQPVATPGAVMSPPPQSPEGADEEGEAGDSTGNNGGRTPPPWPNFNTPPEDHNAKALREAMAKKAAQKKAGLVLAKGVSRYLCLRDNGSGQYRKGAVYPLPDAQHPHPALFRKIQ